MTDIEQKALTSIGLPTFWQEEICAALAARGLKIVKEHMK